MSARSCDQLCPITADHMRAGQRHSSEGTSTLIIRALLIIPAVPPVSIHQCHVSVLIHATCQCPSVPHFSAHRSCLSVPPISAANQCHLSVPVSLAYQCASVPPNSASQCRLTVPVSAA
ncbi:unnamed protein product [Staurois parvus]|uniref:Uncharacterized protein n=1 Tax=Staurois parvus TaxID=386267 RepID=A0ABN9GLC5_9NEOB|nr:unnamed protein product [Staurois parvus]